MQSLVDILTVMIGLVFIYLILSMIVSYLVEMVSAVLDKRSSVLYEAVQLLLNPSTTQLQAKRQLRGYLEEGLRVWYSIEPKWMSPRAAAITPASSVTAAPAETDVSGEAVGTKIIQSLQANPNNILGIFYTHPTIASLTRPGKLPAYINPADFTTTVLDVLQLAGLGDRPPTAADLSSLSPATYLKQIEHGLDCLGNSPLKMTILTYLKQAEVAELNAEARLEALRENINQYFNNTMERASGWYKRWAQVFSLVFAMLLAFAINADTINIFQRLWNDAALREMVSNAAAVYVNRAAPAASASGTASSPAITPSGNPFNDIQQAYGNIPLPLGWGQFPPQGTLPNQLAGLWLLKVVGVLVTGFAISQGSSIWFSALKDLLNLRSTGAPPKDKGDDDSGGQVVVDTAKAAVSTVVAAAK